jgi:hypothetical protein
MEQRPDRDTYEEYRKNYVITDGPKLIKPEDFLYDRYFQGEEGKTNNFFEIALAFKASKEGGTGLGDYQSYYNPTDGILIVTRSYKSPEEKAEQENSSALDSSEIHWNNLKRIAGKDSNIKLERVILDTVINNDTEARLKNIIPLQKEDFKPGLYTFQKGSKEFKWLAASQTCKWVLFLVAEHQGRLDPTQVSEIAVDIGKSSTIQSVELHIRPKQEQA